MRNLFLLIFIGFFLSCKETVLPKPKGYLSLIYPEKSYRKLTLKRPYSFDVLKNTTVINEDNNWLKIKYPHETAKGKLIAWVYKLHIIFVFMSICLTMH